MNMKELSGRWKRFCDALTGEPSPEEKERRRVRDELCRALNEEECELGRRYKELAQRHTEELGQVSFLRQELRTPEEQRFQIFSSPEAFKSACLDKMSELGRFEGEWSTLLDDYTAFVKKTMPVSSPEDVMGAVRVADGISRKRMAVTDMRKGFKAVAVRAGIVPAEEPVIDVSVSTEEPITIFRPLKLRTSPALG